MSKSILVYTEGEVIGDGVIKLAFAGALKNAIPGARLTWLCSGKTVYDSVLKDLAAPLINELIVLDKSRFGLADCFGPSPLSGRFFDILIDTQYRLKKTLWVKRIRHGVFISSTLSYRLSDRKPARPQSMRGRMIDELMVKAALACGRDVAPAPVVQVEAQWEALARKLLPEGPDYIGFVPGAGHESKRWPLERYIALAKAVRERGRVPVFFLGPAEADMAARIRSALPAARFPLDNPHGQENLKSPCLTIALAARLRAAVANDSGGGHLVAAAGVPMVSLFRSASVKAKFLPSSVRVIGLAPEEFDGASIDDIPYEDVRGALESLEGFNQGH